MPKIKSVLLVIILLAAIPVLAQSEKSTPPTTQIAGVVQSFSANILDVKPSASPAVWVTIPDHLRVDRSALKPGADVSVEAYWADSCYVATAVTIKK